MHSTQLPILVDPLPDEPTLGYCLRCASANGVNLHWMRRACGVAEKRMLDHRHVRSLAWTLQADPMWLHSNLPSPTRSHLRASWVYDGHYIQASSHLRRRAPQICHTCVAHHGQCRRSWELALVTVCLQHRTSMRDSCSRCRTSIRWDRPSVGVCHCGRPFGPLPAGCNEPTQAAYHVAMLAEARFAGDRLSPLLAAATLPGFLALLSLDGLLAVIHAFGASRHEFDPIRSNVTSRAMTTVHWSQVAERAVARLRDFARGRPVEGVVAPAILRRLAGRGCTAADIEIALALLDSIDGTAHWRRAVQPKRTQLVLF